MRVLWLCNIMLPMVARQLGMEASNKEGWVSGMAEAVLGGKSGNGIELSVAFPVPQSLLPECGVLEGTAAFGNGAAAGAFAYYGFYEDMNHAERYDDRLEGSMQKILDMAQPDIVHCFGTEYPHTLAMCRVFPKKERLLAGLQGICALYAECYYADLPRQVIHSITLRDYLKKDSLIRQQGKFVLRGIMEKEAVGLAGNITGRTQWDRDCAVEWNPAARYFHMDETLRPEFYGPVWKKEECIPYSIFLSQGDYPLKGLHYMLLALPSIMEKYPDTRVYVAGNSLVAYKTWKEKLKISAYGKYLRRLLSQKGLEGRVVFLGKLDAGQMRDRYLESSLFVCCSAIENSPNSLGEAMLLGMPCVSADVGGIPSIFTGGKDGIMYEGYKAFGGEAVSGEEAASGDRGNELAAIAGRLADAVIKMWDDPVKMNEYCVNAKKHAANTHDKKKNYQRLMEIYTDINGSLN